MKISPRLLATTSTLATSLFLSSIAYASPGDPVVNDGHSAKGEMVQGSRSVGSDEQKTVYTNYYTEGGAGSGGGAGLGGVFFVDQNAKLTLRNVEMLSNSVKGGEGGSVGFVSLSDLNINLPTLSVNADPIQVLGVTPTVSVASDGTLVITGATMSGANSVIGVGAGVSFGGSGSSGKIATIDGTDVTFTAPITVATSAIKQAVVDSSQYSAVSTGTLGKDTLALNGSLSMSDIQQGMVVVGNGIPAGTTITDVVYDADKKVTSVKLSAAVTANVTDFKVVTLKSFDAARFQQVASDSIKPVGVLPGLMAGMTVTGDGFPEGTTIKSVESDGTIVFSNSVNPTAGFSAGTTGASVGSAILNLSSERSDLAIGMAVSGDGIPSGTKITAINGNAITLSNALTSAAAAKIKDNTFVASFGRVLSNSGSTLQLASVDGIKIGALLSGTGVPDNAVVTGIDSASKKVTYRIDAGASQLSTGGAMNGLAANGANGSGGSNGKNGSAFNAALGDGEGQPGLSGGKAGAGRGSAGGTGGNGGSGSSGMPFNTELNMNVASLTMTAINDTTEAVVNWASWSFGMAALKTAQGIKDWVEVGIAAAKLGKWVTDLNNGTVALGGDGGVGGAGGAGDTFYGGGAGGKGGNGGSGARSYTEGGTGGDGGAGGNGGFGAGGGAGGSAGRGGRTGNAPDGADGAGGAAGFGGGVGTSGDGTGGGGGSGYGGAIFVRKGGTLLIAGDALFRNNASLAGSSNNNGLAGNAAGSDLFMMRGSNVTLSPGSGKTIRFEGSIGDDSAASYRNAGYAAGAGADLTITGGGLVQLAGTNTYSGTTHIGGATLQATDGIGINRDSHITFEGGGSIGSLSEGNGGTWLTSGVINRRIGSLPHQISWAGSGGFAAGDDGLVLNFGALDGATGQTLRWNDNGFVTAGSTLIFGSTYGTGEVKLINAVDLNGLTGQIAVYDNAAVTTDHAVLAGKFSNGGLVVNDSGYAGTAYFTAQNSLNALTVNNGMVSTKWNGVVGRMMDSVNGGALTINGGIVDLYAAEKMTTVAVNASGALVAHDALTATDMTVNGKVGVAGAAQIGSLYVADSGQAAFNGAYKGIDIINAGGLISSGTTTVTKVTNLATGQLVQTGDLSASGRVDNYGAWALAGTLTTPVLAQNGMMLVTGTMAGDVETATTRTIYTSIFTGDASSKIGLGGLNGSIANTLVIKQSGDSTYAGGFTGAGNLVKAGVGTLTLTGANDFTGTLAVAGGTLDTTGGGTFANSVAMTVDALATLKIGTDDDIAMLKNAGITHIQALWGMTGLENSGTLDLTGALTVGDKASNAKTGVITIDKGGKASFGAFANDGTTQVYGTLAVAGAAANGGTLNIAAAAGATFGQLANAGALNNAGTMLVSGQLHNQAGGVALLMPGAANQAGTLVNEGVIQAASALTVLGDYVQNAGSLSTTASLDTGSLSGTGGAITLGSTNRFTVIQSHDGAYAGTIGGAQASMVKQGDAVLSLTGQPGSFSVASLTVEKGGVVVTGTDSFGAVDGADAYTQLTVAQPAGFTAQGRIRTGDVTNAGQAVFQGDARTQAFLNQASGTVWTQGATSATGVDNEGRWYLGGDLTAPTVVQNGTMTVTGAIADNTETVATRTIHTAMFSGNAAGVVGLGGIGGTLGHTLVIDQSGDSRYAGIFTGAGNLVKTGAGNLNLTGANSATGTLTVANGTLDTTGGGTFADVVAATVEAPATLVIGTDDTILSLANAGTTRITAASTMAALNNTGRVDVSGGLTVTTGVANLTTGGIGIASGAKALLAQVGNAGSIDNAGALTVIGGLANASTGTIRLAAGASNQAGTLVNEGVIQAASALTVLGDYVQNAGSLSTTASLDTGSLSGTGGAIKLGATNRFTVIQSHDGAYAGTIGGAQASMVKQGDAVLSLTGQPGSFSVASLTVEKGGVVVTGTDSFGAVDGADAYTQLTVAQPAGFTAQGRIRTGDVTNAGQAVFQGDARTQGFLNQASGTVWTQGATSATGVDNEGRWYLGGDLTAPTVVQNGTMTVTGAIADNTETVATRTIHTAMFSGNAAGVVGLGGIGGTLGHTLVIDQSSDSRYAGIFTGAGNLVKTGAGNLNLTGANSATGTLTVANGTLDTTGGGTFADVVAATVEAPATLVIGTDDTILSLANAGTTRITAASTMAALNNTGRVDVSGGLTVTTGVANLTTGGIGIASGAKALLAQVGNAGSIDNAGALTVIGGLANASTGTIRLAAGASNQAGTLVNEGVIQAASALTVLGDYVQNAGSLSTTASLDTGSLSGTGGAIKLGATNRFTVIQSHDGAYAGTIGGAQASMVKQGDAVLSLTGQPGSFSVASLTVEKGGVVVTGTDSFGAVDGADAYTQLTVAQPAGFTAQGRIRTGDVTNAGQALFQGDVKAATVANQASGAVATLGNIVAGSVANDGRWSLGGDMTAAQLVQNGMLTLTGPLANGVEVASARTIKVARFGGAATGVVALGGASGTTVHSLTLDQSDAGLYAGTFQGAGNLIKTSAGALTLTGKNGFTGTLKVSGGTIDTTGGGTFADSLVVTVDAPAALMIGTDDTIGTLANAGATRITAASTMASLGNTGQVAVEGGLTVTGQTSNAATGTVTIAQGASGRFAQIANAGTLSNAGSLRVDGLVDNSFVGTMLLAGGAASRFGSLTNAGSIQANGALTVDGAYVQNAGTLSAGADLATGSLSGQGGTIALTNGAGYALNQTVDGRYAGSITGTGSTLVKTGTGTLTLNGQAGSFATGALLIRVGTVAVDGAGILGQALKVDIAKEAGLTLVRGDQTISNLTGSGTLALNGNNLTLANGGTFFGTVTGTGNVRLTTGAFELTNSIDAQRGTFEVLADSTMNVKATGTLTAPTIAVIGRMNVEGSATATTTTVSNGGILHLGEASTGKAGSLATTTLTVASGGQLTGNGSVTGTTTIGGTSSGMVRPGNSPGTMTFANLTLDAQSGAVMEIEGAAGAGLSAAQGGYDHITVTGTLTLKPGSTLVLANSTGFQPALGQAINIFGVKPGAVSGMFGTATSAFRNAVAFNLSTGNVVGLGANADQFVTRAARTPNAQAMIDQLRVNRTGGVDQYRGGRLIEQVAGALATGNDRAVRDSFDRASPEVYAGLVEHQKLSMLNNTVELGGYGALRDRAVYVTGSIGHDQVKSAADADYIRFKSQDRRFNLGVAAEIPQAKVQFSYGSVNGRVTSAYMNGKAQGDQFGVGVSAPVAADGALRIMGRFSHGDYDLTGTRVTNAGLASFGTVKGKATVYGGGVEYFTLGKRTSLDASAELLQVLSKVRSFAETGVDALTALSVRAQRDNVTVLRARLTAGYMVQPNWQGFARIGVDHELSEALPGVTANVISEDAAFTVRAKGLPDTRLRLGLGTQVDLNARMAWRLEGDVGNSSSYGIKTSIAMRF